MNNCPACEEVAEMKRYGWDDPDNSKAEINSRLFTTL